MRVKKSATVSVSFEIEDVAPTVRGVGHGYLYAGDMLSLKVARDWLLSHYPDNPYGTVVNSEPKYNDLKKEWWVGFSRSSSAD